MLESFHQYNSIAIIAQYSPIVTPPAALVLHSSLRKQAKWAQHHFYIDDALPPNSKPDI